MAFTARYDPGWDYPSSLTFARSHELWGTGGPGEFANISGCFNRGGRVTIPQSPRKHIMKCAHCGASSMIPDSTDKIVALMCPQCGGVLSD